MNISARVKISTDGDNQVFLEGRVREIKPVVSDQKREAIVKIDLPSTNLLKPGMFAKAEIITNTATAMVIPQKAVQSQGDSKIVFTQSGEDLDPKKEVDIRTVRAQKIEVGEFINGDKVEIKSGLTADALVIVDGAGYVKDGDKVRVVTPESFPKK